MADTRNIWMLFAYLLTLSDYAISLKLLELRVPKHVLLGSRPSLICRWELGSRDVLYSIKWYKDGKEFFRHLPKDSEPHRRFGLPGVKVERQNATGSNISLSKATLQTAGRYRCEVSGERPLFPTVSEHADMIVVALPEYGPVISGFRAVYEIGETVQTKCTSGKSKPAVLITWYINGEPVPISVATLMVTEDREGLSTTKLSLDFVVADRHFRNGGLKVKCLATLDSIYWRSNEESAHQKKSRINDTIIFDVNNVASLKNKPRSNGSFLAIPDNVICLLIFYLSLFR